jgi:hypothetical protein
MSQNELRDQAKKWISQGKVIIPMYITDSDGEIKKKPKGRGWQYTKLADCGEILERALVSSYEKANGIGLMTGESTNLLVVDFDSYKEDNLLNRELFQQLFDHTTFAVKTMKGGIQYYFQYNTNLKQTNQKCKIIDIRSNGGVVVTFPTQYMDKKYQPLNDLPINPMNETQTQFLKDYLFPKTILPKLTHVSSASELIPKLLECLVDKRDSYNHWIKIATAVKNALGDDGYSVLLAWTATSPLYKEEKWFETKWNWIKPEKVLSLDLQWLREQARKTNKDKYYTEISSENFHVKRMIDLATESQDPLNVALQYFDKYHYKISDKTVKFAIVEEDQVIITIRKDLIDRYENADITVFDDKGKPKRFNVVKEWLRWSNMHNLSGITFVPDFRNSKLVIENKINLFRRGMHKYDPKFTVDLTVVQPWLNHILEIWADGNQELYDFTIQRMAYSLQNPTVRVPVNIVVRGEHGNGKSCVTDYIGGKVYGRQYYCYYDSMDKFLSEFNSEQEQALFSCLDEINSGGQAYKKSDLLKSTTTRQYKTINNKYGARYTIEDYNNLVFLTNHSSILKLNKVTDGI